MKIDKIMFLVLALITLLVIIVVGFLSRYGLKISEDNTFKLFYNWYIALVLINLFNILSTLIFNFFMIDIPGMKGEKGKVGDKGLRGDDDTCFCNEEANITPMISLDNTETIHSHNLSNDYSDSGSLLHRNIIDNSESTGKIEINHNH